MSGHEPTEEEIRQLTMADHDLLLEKIELTQLEQRVAQKKIQIDYMERLREMMFHNLFPEQPK